MICSQFFNLYSIKYTTKMRHLMFQRINMIVSLQIFTNFEFDADSTFPKSWYMGNKRRKLRNAKNQNKQTNKEKQKQKPH